MLKNLCQKLLAAAAVFVFVAGVAPAGVFAQDSTVQATLEVGPGERRCLDNPTVAYNRASVYDFVVAGEPVKFIFLGRFSSLGYVEISDSGRYPVLSFYDYINARPSFPPSFIPDFFPGTFRTCAKNEGALPSTVSLSLTVN